VVEGKVGRKVMRREMSFQVVEAKDIYNNQTKTMQARSATNARYPAAARDRSRRAEDLRSDEALVDKPEKNVRAASKAETFVQPASHRK